MFYSDIANFYNVKIPESQLNQLNIEASTISNSENSHKRNGQSKQYLREFKISTLKILNHKLNEVLEFWKFN